MLRAITSFSMAEMRNRGLEEAAQIADYYERRGLGPSEIASRIRKLKTTPESRLAEAKVACGTIFALLPDQTGGNWNRNKRTARRT
jgi:hypothetical protein